MSNFNCFSISTSVIFELYRKGGIILKKIYQSIIVFILLLLFVSGCNSINESTSSSKANNNIVQDELLLFINDQAKDHVGSLYTLDEDENRVRVASKVKEGQFLILPNSELILYVDEDMDLFLYVDQDTTHMVSRGVDFGSLMISGDESTIVYLRNDVNDLYMQNISKKQVEERQRIASDVKYYNYELSYDGKFIYYLDESNSLFVKAEEKQSVEIARDVTWYRISDQNQYAFYENFRGDFYVYTFENEENRRIDVNDVLNLQLTHDESMIFFIIDFRYDTGRGELFSLDLEDHSLKWIASDVVQFVLDPSGDYVYYLNDTERFIVNSLSDGENITIATNAVSFQVAPNAKQVIYRDDLDSLYFRDIDQDENIKLANDVSYKVITDETIYVLNWSNTLSYIDDENNLVEIEKEVKDLSLSPNRTILAYVTADERIFFQQGKSEAVEKLSQLDDYSKIYFYNRMLYENLLSINDLVGFWQYEVGPLFEITSNNEVIQHEFWELDKYTTTQEINFDGNTYSSGIMHFIEYGEMSMVELIGNDELLFEGFAGERKKANRLSSEEFNQRLQGLEERMNERIAQFEEEEKLAQKLAAENQQKREAAENLAYDLSYRYVIVPANTLLYDMPSIFGNLIGETIEPVEGYVYDYFIDDKHNVWLEVSDTYEEIWVIAQENWTVSDY